MASLKLAAQNEIVIEKGLPIPEKQGRIPVWPLRSMEIGDSFAVDPDRLVSLRSAIAYDHLKSDRRFTVRTLPHEIRCWRIA